MNLDSVLGALLARTRRLVLAVLIGGLVIATLGVAATVTYEYDDLGRLKTVTYGDGSLTEYVLDAAGNRTSVTSGSPAGAPASITVPANSATGNYSITWTAPTSGPAVTAYQLFQASYATFTDEQQVYSGLNVTFPVTNRPNGTYYYRVRACANAICSLPVAGSTGVLVAIPPSTPTNLTAPSTNNTGNYTVSWNPSTTGAGPETVYELWEATNSGFSGESRVYNSTGTSTSLTRPAATYYYRVRACTVPNCSTFSAGSPGTIVSLPPATPAPITAPATNNTGAYRVSWTGVSGAVTAYELYEANNASFTGETRVFNALTPLYLDVSGKANGTYYYRARACNTVGCSSHIASTGTTVALPPGAPNSITVPPTNTTGGYTISWSAPLTGTVTGYQLYEASNSSFTGEINIYSGTNLNFAVTGKGNGSYWYRVRACNGTGNCGGLTGGGPTVVALPPGQPGALSMPGTNTTGSYTVSWGASSSGTVSQYQLEQFRNDPGYTTIPVVWTSATTSVNVTVTQDGVYSYRVRACYSTSCSGYTNGGGVGVTLPPGAPATITVPGTSNDGSIALTWAVASSGTPTSYQVYEATNSSFTGETSVFGANGTNTTLTNRGNGSYWYRVRACNGSGCSGFASGGPTVVTRAPGAPASISISAPSNTGAYTISWGAVSSGVATRYELWEATNSSYSGEARVFDANGTSTPISGRVQGPYYYRVRGCNVTSCGGFTAVASPQLVDTTAPGAPQNVSAPAPGQGHAVVTWVAPNDNLSGIASYEWKLSTQSTWNNIGNVVTTTVFSLSPQQTYTFEIRARDGANNIGGVATTTFTTLPPTPLAPTNLRRELIASCAWRGSWDASANATSYVFRQTNGPDIPTTSLTETVSCDVGNPDSNKPRSVRACNISGCSGDVDFGTPIDTTPPTAPSNIILGTVFPTSVTASWALAYDANGVQGYEYSLNGGSSWSLAGSTNSVNLTSLSPQTTYNLTVRAYDFVGLRGPQATPTVQFTTPQAPDTTPPSAPGNVRVTSNTASAVRIDWDAATDNVGVIGYQWRFSTSPTWTQVNASTFFVNLSTTGNTSYTFEIQARDGAGNLSQPVTQLPFTTPAGIPPTPTWATAVQGGSCWWRAEWQVPSGSTATYWRLRDKQGVEANVGAPPQTVNCTDWLDPQSNYPVWVKACNNLGCSAKIDFTRN